MPEQETFIDLIFLETSKFILHIKGKPVHPRVTNIKTSNSGNDYQSLLQLNHIDCNLEKFEYYDAGKSEYNTLIDEKNEIKMEKIYPLFYEEQDYQIYIEGKENCEISFSHENEYLKNAVSPMPGKNNILWGTINFRSDVGYSELLIKDKNRTILKLKIEVFPTKIDYRQDYYNLLQEVNQEVYNLAYDFLRRTFQGMQIKETDQISDVEFFQILQAVFDDFIKAFHRIKRAPHHRLQRTKEVLPAALVKKINRNSIKWLKKNSEFYDQKMKLPIKMLNIDKKISFDTFENKFVKWIIFQLIKKITTFKQRYKKSKGNYDQEPDQRIIARAEAMINELDYLIYNTFLEEVGDLHKIDSLTLVFQMAPGYKEIYRYYLMLMKGLSLEGELTRLSMKQLWQLYEYWCYLKLNRLLANKYKLLKSNLIDFNYSGIYVTLNTGKRAQVKYENPDTGECFSLIYNQEYSYFNEESDNIKYTQKPDNILSLEKSDFPGNENTLYKFIFDAKYRLDPGLNGDTSLPGPEKDTINTMHRYRDAIVYGNKDQIQREMVGAYVLFPYDNEEEFKQHPFYKSIDRVNVGAFPFLPGHAELVTDFLDNIINESSLGSFERNVLPRGITNYQEKTNFQQDVLVGSLRQKKQLFYCLHNNLYYTPYKENIMNHELKYVAIYQSENKFKEKSGVRYYGKIENIDVKKRKEIEFPSSRNKPERLYIVFDIEEWEELDKPIKPEGYGVSGAYIYTNFMLLHKAETLPELSLKTVKEWRVWLELKRIKKEIKVKVKNKQLEQIEEIDGFQSEGISVEIKGNKIFCRRENNEPVTYDYRSFVRNPRSVLKGIFDN